MSLQKFYASPDDTFTSPNGAIGHRIGGPMDCLGPYAKVRNCPVAGVPGLRLTAYATGYADTAFSIPACTRYRGKYIGGYFSSDENGTEFRPYDRFKAQLATYTEPSKAFLRMGSDYLEDAEPYKNKKAAIEAYREVAQDLANYGQDCEGSIHFAQSKDDLHEYPDFVLSLGPRGGVRVGTT